jgi:carboxyl-terminal processing protease
MRPSFHYMMILVLGVVLGFGLSVGRTVNAERDIAAAELESSSVATASSESTVSSQDAPLLAEVLERVRAEYVEDVSDEQLIEAAIRGMIADLDPHSAFLDRKQFNEVRISTSGAYSGVGIEATLDDGIVRVVTPIENTPAARAGVLAGDRILAVDDVTVDSEHINDTIDRMRGAAGTTVKITIERSEAAEPLEFMLERASVQVHSVRKELLESGVGYVRITHFSDTTAADLERAIGKLMEQNTSSLRGLVLDLRNNPGGVLEAAVAVSDLFLDDGLIVSASGRAADAQFEMQAKPGDLLEGAPIIVLVNGGSASASEIVAGALKDHRRAALLGRQTYGKGSVQTVMPLSDGHAIKLTTSRYYTPSGASIHESGITPDHIVSEATIQAALGARSPIFGNLGNDYELRVALNLLMDQSTMRQSRVR